ncbi:MAG: hypothetical protein K8F60_07885, partial [Melioribacteraceae bacterium]|nr:hypothetical protein [Melioribacteraceae bacterium]
MDGSKNYRRVIKKLHQSINEIGLNDSIIIRSIGSDLIRNRFDAHKFCRSKKIDLIIWGQTDYGFRNNEKILLFEVYHTLNISSNISSKLDLFLSDLNLIFAKRSWAIKEINELEEYKIVANNFLETILFILGIFFYDEGHFTQSIKVFEFLLPILEKKNLKEKTDDYKLQTNRVKYLLNELYFLYSRILHDENKIKESFIYLRKIQEEIISNPIPLFINLARVSYLLGDLENAKNYTEKIRKINRR